MPTEPRWWTSGSHRNPDVWSSECVRFLTHTSVCISRVHEEINDGNFPTVFPWGSAKFVIHFRLIIRAFYRYSSSSWSTLRATPLEIGLL